MRPEDGVSACSRVDLEIMELDHQLARIRLLCRDLQVAAGCRSAPAETCTSTAGTTASTDSVTSSSGSSTLAINWADSRYRTGTLPRRAAAVPRMGIGRRHTTDGPTLVEHPLTPAHRDVGENSTAATTAADAIPTSRQPDSSFRRDAAAVGARRLRCDTTNCPSSGASVKDSSRVTRPPEVENATPRGPAEDNIPTASRFSWSGRNPVAAYANRLRCENSDCPSDDPLTDPWVTRTRESDSRTSVTGSVREENNASTPASQFRSSLSNHVSAAGTRRSVAENTRPLIHSVAPNWCNNCALPDVSFDDDDKRGGTKYDRLALKLDEEQTGSRNSALERQSISAKHAWVKDPTPKIDSVSPSNVSASPHRRHRQRSSSTGRVAAAARRAPESEQTEIDVRVQRGHGIGDDSAARGRTNSATDRKSVLRGGDRRDAVDRCLQTNDAVDDDDGGDVRRTFQQQRQRQELYWRYADIMYTNPVNLKHTIAVQQVRLCLISPPPRRLCIHVCLSVCLSVNRIIRNY